MLGIERYNKLCHKKQFSLTKDHFSKERFLKVEEGDTFYGSFSNFKSHDDIPDKWDEAKYVGIKYPRIDEIVDELKLSLGNIAIIYIYRDIFEVAESWNRRAEEAKNWPANKNYTKAVVQWNNSLARTKELLQRGENIICVNYEDLVFKNKKIDSIFHWLGLKMDGHVKNQLNIVKAKAGIVKAKKGKLSDEHFDYINERANLQLFREFNNKYNILG